MKCQYYNCENTWEDGPSNKLYCSRRCNENARRKKKIALCNELVKEMKSVPCMDCGISYPPYVMDFDHVRGTKISNVSEMTADGNLTKLAAEIDKCDVVCSNCHRERTFSRGQHLANITGQ